jgi:hypothetical protein
MDLRIGLEPLSPLSQRSTKGGSQLLQKPVDKMELFLYTVQYSTTGPTGQAGRAYEFG